MKLFEQLQVLGDLFVHPRRAMTRIGDHALWIVPILVAGCLNLTATVLALPYSMRAFELSIPAGTPAARIEMLHRQMEIGKWISFGFVPMVTAVQCLFVAAILWLCANGLVGRCQFRKVFAITAHAHLLRSLVSVLEGLVLHSRGIGSIRTKADLNVPIGLDAIFSSNSNLVVQSLLGRINPMEIAYLILVVIGISAVFRVSEKRAAAVTLGHWVAGLGFQTFVVTMAQVLKPQ